MNIASRLLLLIFQTFIKAYQWLISPVMLETCRHLPTCSQYAIESLELYGPYKGFWLAINRILRCHPWGTSGCDPVPQKSMSKNNLN
jgi:putative membrane protein insertion efficiency factor